MRGAIAPESQPLPPRYRWISAFEVILGTFLVVGHNIFTIAPNEIFFLFALFCISFKLRDGGWSVAGLTRPRSWRKTVLVAIAAVVVLQVGSELVIQPLAELIARAVSLLSLKGDVARFPTASRLRVAGPRAAGFLAISIDGDHNPRDGRDRPGNGRPRSVA